MIARTLALATLLTTLASAQTIQVNKENKTIAITSTDSASKPADTAEISIGFTTFGTAQDTTYADCSRISNQVMQALIGAGLHKDQIASNEQSLSTIDTNDKPRFDQGLRFVCSQSWKVTTSAASAADVLHLAVTAGANNSGAIEWKLADDDALEAEAAEKALAHAHQIAERMAKGLNAKLGPLVYASNQEPNRFGFATLQTSSASIGSQFQITVKPLAIVPDKVTRTATVYAVFAIE